jgi:hypothetical protein
LQKSLGWRRITPASLLVLLAFSSFASIIQKDASAEPQPLAPPNPSGIIQSFPITITNFQSVPTPAPFQQMVTVDNAPLFPYEASNLQNVEFFDSSGQVITSWLESGNSSASTDSVYWLNLPDGINAESSVTVYIGFASLSTSLLNRQTTGEAPQLSNPYGAYDDGANVFSLYENFAGTTMPNGWTSGCASPQCPQAAVTIDNGFSDVTPSNSNFQFYSTATFPDDTIAEMYGYFTQVNITAGNFNAQFNYGGLLTPSDSWFTNQESPYYYYGTDSGGGGISIHGGSLVQTSLGLNTGYHVISIAQNGSSTYFSLDYNNQNQTVQQLGNSSQIWFNTSDNGDVFGNWIRIRALPPNGIMPTVEVNGQSQTTTSSSTSTSTLTSTSSSSSSVITPPPLAPPPCPVTGSDNTAGLTSLCFPEPNAVGGTDLIIEMIDTPPPISSSANYYALFGEPESSDSVNNIISSIIAALPQGLAPGNSNFAFFASAIEADTPGITLSTTLDAFAGLSTSELSSGSSGLNPTSISGYDGYVLPVTDLNAPEAAVTESQCALNTLPIVIDADGGGDALAACIKEQTDILQDALELTIENGFYIGEESFYPEVIIAPGQALAIDLIGLQSTKATIYQSTIPMDYVSYLAVSNTWDPTCFTDGGCAALTSASLSLAVGPYNFLAPTPSPEFPSAMVAVVMLVALVGVAVLVRKGTPDSSRKILSSQRRAKVS